MFLVIFALITGVLAGTVTGLIPGIHVNLVCAILLSLATTLLPITGVLPLALFIVAMATTHTFLDVIPSVFLGAPDADMVLSVLPGHRLLLAGRGIHAVRLTQIGSLGAIILSSALFPLFLLVVRKAEAFLDQYILVLLLTVILFLLVQAHKKIITAILFVCSGALGHLVFSLPYLHNPLFPLLTGLFGTSALILSLENAGGIPQQHSTILTVKKYSTLKAIIAGQGAGFLTAVLPGLGSAAAAALASAFIKLKEESFLVLVGSIGTVNFVLSLVTFLAYDKARNGAILAVQALANNSFSLVLACLGAALVAGGMASCVLIFLTPQCVRILQKISYTKLVKIIIFLLILTTAILSGWYGLLILTVATGLGLLAPLCGVQRIYLMGCLLIPVVSYLW